MKVKVKTCPVCNSVNLKWIYYAPPAKQAPYLWDFDEDGYSPLILYKRIECKECGATVPGLAMTLDDAVDYWNRIKDINDGSRFVLQKIGEETVLDVEPLKEETK